MTEAFLPPSGVFPAPRRNRRGADTDIACVSNPKAREPGAILMVEDDAVFAEAFCRWLRRRHAFDRFEIVFARGVDEATYALRRSRRFAGFLVDWRLGWSESAEPLLARIRQLYPRPATPL